MFSFSRGAQRSTVTPAGPGPATGAASLPHPDTARSDGTPRTHGLPHAGLSASTRSTQTFGVDAVRHTQSARLEAPHALTQHYGGGRRRGSRGHQVAVATPAQQTLTTPAGAAAVSSSSASRDTSPAPDFPGPSYEPRGPGGRQLLPPLQPTPEGAPSGSASAHAAGLVPPARPDSAGPDAGSPDAADAAQGGRQNTKQLRVGFSARGTGPLATSDDSHGRRQQHEDDLGARLGGVPIPADSASDIDRRRRRGEDGGVPRALGSGGSPKSGSRRRATPEAAEQPTRRGCIDALVDALLCRACRTRQSRAAPPYVVRALHDSAGGSVKSGGSYQSSHRARGIAGVSNDSDGALARGVEKRVFQWRRGEPIGKGAFGVVYLGLNLDTGALMAVKEVNVELVDRKAVATLQSEIDLMRSLHHDNIVQYVGTEMRTDTQTLFVFTSWVPGGSIRNLLAKFGKLSEKVVAKYTRQLLLGLEYLHSRNVVHRDIKGANALVDDNGTIKLADFGSSVRVNTRDATGNGRSKRREIHGTPYFMAPEVIRQEPDRGKESDIWSLGCTVLQMVSGQPPWRAAKKRSVEVLMVHIATCKEPPPMPDDLSPALRSFLEQCFQQDPSKRGTASSLLQHPFIARAQKHVPQPSRLSSLVMSGDSFGGDSSARDTAAVLPNHMGSHLRRDANKDVPAARGGGGAARAGRAGGHSARGRGAGAGSTATSTRAGDAASEGSSEGRHLAPSTPAATRAGDSGAEWGSSESKAQPAADAAPGNGNVRTFFQEQTMTMSDDETMSLGSRGSRFDTASFGYSVASSRRVPDETRGIRTVISDAGTSTGTGGYYAVADSRTSDGFDDLATDDGDGDGDERFPLYGASVHSGGADRLSDEGPGGAYGVVGAADASGVPEAEPEAEGGVDNETVINRFLAQRAERHLSALGMRSDLGYLRSASMPVLMSTMAGGGGGVGGGGGHGGGVEGSDGSVGGSVRTATSLRIRTAAGPAGNGLRIHADSDAGSGGTDSARASPHVPLESPGPQPAPLISFTMPVPRHRGVAVLPALMSVASTASTDYTTDAEGGRTTAVVAASVSDAGEATLPGGEGDGGAGGGGPTPGRIPQRSLSEGFGGDVSVSRRRLSPPGSGLSALAHQAISEDSEGDPLTPHAGGGTGGSGTGGGGDAAGPAGDGTDVGGGGGVIGGGVGVGASGVPRLDPIGPAARRVLPPIQGIPTSPPPGSGTPLSSTGARSAAMGGVLASGPQSASVSPQARRGGRGVGDGDGSADGDESA